MAQMSQGSTANMFFLTSLKQGAYFKSFDLCSYIITYLNITKDKCNGKQHYNGPATFLTEKIVSLYLEKESPTLHKRIVNLKPKKLEMSWQTEMNFVDCGIFAMRHMETYMAKEMKERKEDCGILEERSGKQHDRLLDLRFKYLSKILLLDINILHDE
ncbi:hypothetical protein R6Q57_014625, partial [Mikania cordata]